jgi:pilus assembly protein CpaB
MRLSSVVLLAVALLLGLGAVFLTMNWLEQQRSAPLPTASAPETKMRRVVVASQPLRFGTELTSINLKEVDWPSGAVPAGTFSTTTELTKSGERRVALAAIERDEPVLSWKVTGPGQRASLSAVLGSDKKAMTIRVNDVSGTAGFVLPGDRVDVLLTRTEDKTGYTDVLLQNVRALGIDQLADERTEKPSVAKAVTLEVTTTEAQKLALAQTVGQLSLALRQAGAAAATTTRRISIADLGENEWAQPPIIVTNASTATLAPRGTIIGVTRPIKDKEDNFKRVEYRVRREGSRP